MIKLTVFNLEEFLQIVNNCTGAVKIIGPDGKRQDISTEYEIQLELRRRHRDNQHCLELMLDIPNPKDYFKLVYFTMGDC